MLIMALIRNGHSRVWEYPYSMFETANAELRQHTTENIANMAYAHRVSKTSDDNWKKFMKQSEKEQTTVSKPKEKKKMTKEDHMRVIKRLRGIQS